MEKITVIIPTYNRGTFLKRTISSVLAQTHEPYEIIVSDDGSTDTTQVVVKSFKHTSIKLITGSHSGLPAVTRNRALKIATGDFVAFLDDDDAWVTTKLKDQLALLSKNPGSLACCTNALRVTPSGEELGSALSISSSFLSLATLEQNNFVICSSVLVRRSLFEKTGFFSELPEMKSIEDYDLWLKIAQFTPFAYLPTNLVKYTEDNPDSVRSIYNSHEVWKQRRIIWRDVKQWSDTTHLPIFQKTGILKNYLKYELKGLVHDTSAKV